MPRVVLSSAFWAWALALLVAGTAAAEDSIVVATADGQQQRYFGTIQDYTGTSLTILTTTRELTFPAEQVVKIETQLSEPHRLGNEQFAAGQFEAATDQYHLALRAENRVWVRRMILDGLLWCQRRLGRQVDAATTFLLLAESDPATPYFSSIPLHWLATPPDPAMTQQAAAWINDPRPLAQLIAASWLLSGGNRQQAINTLQQLADRSEDARIARLARTQLWRTEVLAADAATAARWQRYVEAMPAGLRAGPTYLLGTAQSRLGESEQAALTLLKVPILYPEQAELAPEALAAAGRELEKLGRVQEAARLYREAVRDYPQSPLAEPLRQKLEELADAPAAAASP